MIKQLSVLATLAILASTAHAQSGKPSLEEKRALARLACKDMGKEEKTLDCKGKTIDQIVKQIEFEKVDLNADGQTEFMLSVPVEVLKSVDVAIYQKVGRGYRLLFCGLSRGVEVKKTKSNGYYDLEEMDAGAGPVYTTYKYDGKMYKKK